MDSFWSTLLSVVSESGVWAMLFVTLLIVLITGNNRREERYQEIIRALGNSLKKVEEIKEDVEDIKFGMGIGGNSKLQTNQQIVNQINGDQNDTERKDKDM